MKNVDDIVDLIFSFDSNELENEANFLKKYKKLQQENKILRENAEHNDKVVDKVNREIYLLKKQKDDVIQYIRKHFQDDEGIVCKRVSDNICRTNENFIDELLRMLGEIE